MKKKITKMSKLIIKRGLLVLAILIIWSIGSKHANPIFVPAPNKVFEDLIITLKDGSLWLATIYSLRRIALATILSTIISLPIGLLIYNVPIASDILAPIAAAMRYLPVTAFYPLLIMWFGIDPNRIVTVGNGSSNPMYDNNTEEHRALNRRTDVSFKIIESN